MNATWAGRLGYLAALIAASVLGVAASSFAVVQDGRNSTNTQSLDAASVYIAGSSFNARGSQCVLYGMLSYDTNARHVESGVVRCGSNVSGGIDGTCPSGQVFNERFTGTTYICNPGGTFSVGSYYYAYNQRGASDTFTTTMGGASISQGGFTGLTRTWAWGETTPNNCPNGSANGAFSLWSRTINGSSASVGGSEFHGGSGGPCWTVGSIDSGGSFNVTR